MSEKNKVLVRIMGHEYTICSEDSREFVQKVANYVDDKMREICERNSKLSTALISVLTALNVADDYFKILDSQYAQKSISTNEEQKFNIVIQSLNEELEKKIKVISELEEVVGLAEQKLHAKDEEIELKDRQILQKDEQLKIKTEQLRKCNEQLELKNKEFLQNQNELININEKFELKQKELCEMEKELNEFIETFDEDNYDCNKDSQISLL